MEYTENSIIENSFPGITPTKIISLVPSQTELLFDLELFNEVIGITKFCIHPKEWYRNKTRIGGTKTVDVELIKQLKPDLIIANKEENVKEQIEALQEIAPVHLTDVSNLEEALTMITDVGKLTGKAEKAIDIVKEISQSFLELSIVQDHPAESTNYNTTACYLIWREPYMTIGADTFIHDMLRRCGFINVFANRKRYPVITVKEIRATGCEVLFLSSEPYPFKQNHMDELQAQLPGCRIQLVDGELFSWYGSRLKYSANYFKTLQHSGHH
jgi:ABC-type Fe3+-hydroxamate transport system substrate-binding protein